MDVRNIPIWKKSLSHDEWVNLKLSVGTHKKIRRLSPVGVARLLQRLRDSGATFKEITKEILLGSSTISKFLRLIQVPVEFEDLIDWGYNKEKISFTQASLSMSKALIRTESIFLLKQILEEGLNKNEIQKIVELKSRSELTIEQVVNEILNDRVMEIRKNMMIGFIDDDVKPIINTMDAKTIDSEFKKLLKGVFPLVDIYSAKINTGRFTLTTDEFGQRQIELKARKENVDYNSLIMSNIRKMWGDA